MIKLRQRVIKFLADYMKPFNCNPLTESDIEKNCGAVFGNDDNNETSSLIRQIVITPIIIIVHK